MSLSPEQSILIDKVSVAVNYCMKEGDITVYDVIGALEIVKLQLMHKMQHNCQKCGNQSTCNHCGNPHP